MSANQNKTAIITGASRGIGVALAKRLAADGFNVVINYASSAAPAEELADSLKSQGHKAIAIKADIARPDAVKALFDKTIAEFGGVDVIVNNAGVMTTTPIADMDDATYDAMMDINVRGTFNMLREGAKHLRDHGRVINFSTTALHLKLPGYAVYNATKAAVGAFSPRNCAVARLRSMPLRRARWQPNCSSMARPTNRLPISQRCHRLNGLVNLMTSPVWWPSSPGRIPAGWMVRPSVPMVVLPDLHKPRLPGSLI